MHLVTVLVLRMFSLCAKSVLAEWTIPLGLILQKNERIKARLLLQAARQHFWVTDNTLLVIR